MAQQKTRHTGPKCLSSPHPVFSQNQLAKRVQSLWPQSSFLDWPQLWINHSRLTGHYAWATFWTGPQTSGRTRSWSSSLSGKALTKVLPPATISSWIKQTVIPCYELSSQEAFAFLKTFQLDISLEQLLPNCYWNSNLI